MMDPKALESSQDRGYDKGKAKQNGKLVDRRWDDQGHDKGKAKPSGKAMYGWSGDDRVPTFAEADFCIQNSKNSFCFLQHFSR